MGRFGQQIRGSAIAVCTRLVAVASLVVVTGPPGAGKSTVARLVADHFEPSVLIEGDSFFDFLAHGAIEPWLPESHAQNDVVIRAAAAAAGAYVEGGYDTVFDGVVGPWFVSTFLAATGLPSLDYAVLFPPVEVCVDRVTTRTGHGFSDEAATRKMHDEFAGADVEARHVHVDPPQTADAVADMIVARMKHGDLRYSQRPGAT